MLKEQLKIKKDELFEEKKEEFRKTMNVDQTIDEVDVVDPQDWRKNTSSSNEDDDEIDNSLTIHFNLPKR